MNFAISCPLPDMICAIQSNAKLTVFYRKLVYGEISIFCARLVLWYKPMSFKNVYVTNHLKIEWNYSFWPSILNCAWSIVSTQHAKCIIFLSGWYSLELIINNKDQEENPLLHPTWKFSISLCYFTIKWGIISIKDIWLACFMKRCSFTQGN